MNSCRIFRQLSVLRTLLLASILLTACQPAVGKSLVMHVADQAVDLPAVIDTVESISQPQMTVIPVQSIPTEQPSRAPGTAPLRFTLPTPDEAPVSLWRPALYQVPWALSPFDHFYFARPIAADEVNWPLASYRYGGIFPGTTDVVHTGIDIDAPKRTPVIAAARGTVIWADYGLFTGARNRDDPYGLAVAIRHEFGLNGQRLYTVYAHMDELLVSAGEEVELGDTIGLVGETGNTTGPHLHFEVRIKNNNFYTTLNPELWLAPPVGWGVLAGRMLNTNGSLLESQDVTVIAVQGGRRWVVRSYGPRVVNSDSYYRENLVLSDLPAGEYQIVIDYLEDRYRADVTIKPGAITYFTFQGERGFGSELPPIPLPGETQ